MSPRRLAHHRARKDRRGGADPVGQRRYSQLIAGIYDSALGRRSWDATLEEIAHLFGARQASLLVAGPGVARQERAESAPEIERGTRRHAETPGGGAHGETETGEDEDGRETPADALNAVEDIPGTGAPNDPGEQRHAAERARGRDEPRRDAAAGDHTCRRVSTCFRVSSIRLS